MNKEIRLRCNEEVSEAADLAASRVGLTVSAYARMALLERMARDGIHPEQPRAD